MTWKLINGDPQHLAHVRQEITEVCTGDENTIPIAAEELTALESAGYWYDFDTGQVQPFDEAERWPAQEK